MEATDTSRAQLDLVRLLSLVERRVVLRLEDVLKQAGSTVQEWRVMSLLADGKGRPMSEIADHALLPAPTLTKVIDRMVSTNLVYRRVDDRDRRRVLVFLAPRGHERYRRLGRAVKREETELAELAGEDLIAQLGSLLARLAESLSSPIQLLRPG
ncbi:MAG TPA: MarR family winged helix-turn-helix transcriptional regulator [Actinomycetes bacterium]|nr:MarR family winged helix-turn-helix transcriptional regulator [Actinomycetes bacterium]